MPECGLSGLLRSEAPLHLRRAGTGGCCVRGRFRGASFLVLPPSLNLHSALACPAWWTMSKALVCVWASLALPGRVLAWSLQHRRVTPWAPRVARGGSTALTRALWDSSLFLGCWLGGSVCRGARSQASPGGAGTRCSPWSRGSYGEEGPGVSLGMGVRRGAGRSAVPSHPHLVMANSSLRALSTRGQALCGRCIGQFLLHLPSLTRLVAHFAAEELRPRPGKKAARLQLYVSRRQTPLRGTGPALGSRPTEEGLPHSLALLRMPWSSRVAPAGPTKPDSAPSQGQEVSSAGFTAQVL